MWRFINFGVLSPSYSYYFVVLVVTVFHLCTRFDFSADGLWLSAMTFENERVRWNDFVRVWYFTRCIIGDKPKKKCKCEGIRTRYDDVNISLLFIWKQQNRNERRFEVHLRSVSFGVRQRRKLGQTWQVENNMRSETSLILKDINFNILQNKMANA